MFSAYSSESFDTGYSPLLMKPQDCELVVQSAIQHLINKFHVCFYLIYTRI